MNRENNMAGLLTNTKNRTFIIAEAGVNHNGRVELAKKMIESAKHAGADAIKFQAFIADNLTTKSAQKAQYQKIQINDPGSQLEMLRRLELSFESQRILYDYCDALEIQYLASPFDLGSVDFLHGLGMGIFKIPSGEITNLPFLRRIGRLGRPVILSTGMSTMDEIRDAMQILTTAGTKKDDICILHCNTEYPTPYGDVNLKVMAEMAKKFAICVGMSDHSRGIEVPIAAVALGASVIEKHFTLDRNLEGPDHSASLTPEELKQMVNAIRNIEEAMGDGQKKVTNSERKNLGVVRKSIVAAKQIRAGERFSENNITTKRPGTGISPMQWDNIIGTVATRDYKKDELI